MGFGLYPQAGLLPAARATLCAMECTDRLRHKGLARCHAGIATGPVFCGSLGSRDRRVVLPLNAVPSRFWSHARLELSYESLSALRSDCGAVGHIYMDRREAGIVLTGRRERDA